jgi:hypothetical protein
MAKNDKVMTSLTGLIEGYNASLSREYTGKVADFQLDRNEALRTRSKFDAAPVIDIEYTPASGDAATAHAEFDGDKWLITRSNGDPIEHAKVTVKNDTNQRADFKSALVATYKAINVIVAEVSPGRKSKDSKIHDRVTEIMKLVAEETDPEAATALLQEIADLTAPKAPKAEEATE